jgi:hypothetical protein
MLVRFRPFTPDEDLASQDDADPDQISPQGQKDKQEEPKSNLGPNQQLAML